MRLLEGHHGGSAPGVSNVDPLDVTPQPQRPNQQRVQTWTEAARAGGGDQKVHLARLAPFPAQRVCEGAHPQVDTCFTESLLKLVHALRRRKTSPLDGQVTAIDVAVQEE